MQRVESYSLLGISPQTAYLPPAATSVVSDDLRAEALAIANAYRAKKSRPAERRERKGEGRDITAAEYRAHRDGTRRLPDGRYSLREAGRTSIVDIGQSACAASVLQRKMHRADLAQASLSEKRC
jgi:hypothetical protein